MNNIMDKFRANGGWLSLAEVESEFEVLRAEQERLQTALLEIAGKGCPSCSKAAHNAMRCKP